MFALHLVQRSPGPLTEQIVYLGASGLGRFVVLRLFVFASGRGQVTVPVRVPAPRPVRPAALPAA